jgi:DNA end-binding protein Ku
MTLNASAPVLPFGAIIALEAFGKGFLGTTLRYDYEVRDPKPYIGSVPSPRVDKEIWSILPKAYLSAKQGASTDEGQGSVRGSAKKLVKRKAAAHTIEAKAQDEDRSNVVDLMDALKQSMGKRATAKKTVRKSNARRKRKTA